MKGQYFLTRACCLTLACCLLLLTGCGRGAAAGPDEDSDSAVKVEVRVPVTFVSIDRDAMNDYIELNAVSAFLQKSYIKANANGYLQTNGVFPGKQVEAGESLFTLKTKEASTIGNSIKILDSTFKFSGLIAIRANQHGYITQLNHQSGDYVQDGEQLAVISDRSSFVFLLNVPYELRSFVLSQRTVQLLLPDGEKLDGTIGPTMPTVDSASQTQSVVIRVKERQPIPENLIAKVRILKTARIGAQSLPRTAVLTDETESHFWVMKMIDSITAVKIPVKKGLETPDRIEILAPVFAPSDRILVSGNYGLPDTVKVTATAQPDNPAAKP